MRRFCTFIVHVLRGFKRNKGFLLSGAVAYYTLLSIVPMSILSIVVLTNFIEEQKLLLTLSTYLEMVIPGYAATLTDQVRAFLAYRKLIGVIGFSIMLFFSSLAFSTLEDAMSVIFHVRAKNQKRKFIISAIIPYAYFFIMVMGILLASIIVGGIETLESRQLSILGKSVHLGGATGRALYFMGIVGEVLMLTSIYLIMPVGRVSFCHALVGGTTAMVLWEITRRVLIWYYSAISMVNVIYGSIAITVVALLSIEVVAIILLLGAQVISELENGPHKHRHYKS